PLLSPYGKVVAIAPTQEIQVTDTGKIMPLVGEIIEAMPEPATATPAVPATPEPQELQVYSVKVADPETVVSILTQLVPTATFVLDPDTNRINANATASQHTLVASVLEKMEEELPPEQQPVLEAYPIDAFLQAAPTTTTFSRRRRFVANGTSAQLLETLQKIVPGAELTINETAGTLLALATPAEHETIKTALEKLVVERAPTEMRQLQTYRLTRSDPETTRTLLETILPDARLTVDPQTRTLVALAVPADQAVIKDTLQTLQPEKPGPDAPELQFYELPLAMPPSLLEVIQKVAPQAQVAMGDGGELLMIVAAPAEHARISKTIDQITKKTFVEGRNQLAIYPVTPSQRTRFEAVMSSLTAQLPGMQVITDAEPGELAVWAKPTQHEVIKEILEELKRDLPAEEKFQLAGYAITSADPASVLTMLQELFPKTKLVLDPKGNRLLAWTSPTEHESIKSSLEQIEAEQPADVQPRFEAYAVRGTDLTTGGPALVAQVQTLVPDARLTLDPRNAKLIAYALPKDHELLKAALASLDREATPETEPTVEVYPLTKAEPTATLALLATLVPEAQLTSGATGDTLIARAVAADHEVIKATLEKLQPEGPDPNAPQLQFYPFEKDPPASLTTILANLIPKAQITVDPEEGRLVVMATPSDHEIVLATIERFKEATPDREPLLVVYPVRSIDSTSLVTLLAGLVPEAQLSVEPMTGNLVALARAEEHQIIQDTVDQLQPETPGPNTPVLRFHPLADEPPAEMATVLQGLVPKAQITVDAGNKRLMVVASAADHDTIQTTVAEFETNASTAPELRFHPLIREPPADLLTVLTPLVPKAQITLDTLNKRLMAVASPEDHEIIRSTVEEFEAHTPPEEPSKLAVYRVTPAQKSRFDLLVPTLTPEMPGMTIIGQPSPDELAIWAKPTQHLVLEEIIEQLTSDEPDEEKRKLIGYPVKSVDPASVLTMLQQLYPDAQLLLDPKANRLLAWMRPEEHDSIQSSLEAIEGAAAPDEQSRFEAFSVQTADAATIITALQPLVPNARLSLDAKSKRLIVWGTPTELKIIRTAVESLSQAPTAETTPTLEVYPLKKADPQTTLTLLQGLIPDAEFTLDAVGGRLIALAAPADHEIIKSTLEKVHAGPPAEDRPRFETYPILGADVPAAAAALLATLQPLVPTARLTVDPKSKQLVAWGTPDEQEIIRTAVESMGRGGGSPETTPQLEVYPLTKADPTSTLALLTSLVPDARLNVDPQTNSVVALAIPADQQTIKATLARLEPENQEPKKLVVYPVTSAQKTRFQALVATLTEELPGIQVIADEEPDEVAVWAKPSQHVLLADIIAQLEQEATEEQTRQLTPYALKSADPTAVLTMMQELYPDVKFVLEPTRKRLLAWARAGEHASIKASIEQVAGAGPAEDQPRFETFPIYGADVVAGAPAFLSALQLLVPSARLTVDPKNRKLVAWGTPEELSMVRKAVESMGRDGESPETTPQLEVYRLTKADPTSTLTLLAGLVPDARLNIDPQSNSLVALAIPADQATIKATLERLQPAVAGPNTPLLRFHPLIEKPSENLATVLQELAPQAQITLDVDNDRVMAVATPADHEIIRSTIEEYEAGTPPLEPRKLVVYPVTSAHKKRFQALVATLTEELPGIQVIADEEPDELAVWAKPSQHVAIAGVLEQIQREAPEGQQFRLGVYRLKSVDPESALAVFERLLPDTDFIVDQKTRRLMAWTSPEEHAKIQSALEAMESGEPGEFERELVVYPVSEATPQVAVEMLQELLPDVSFTVDAAAGTILAWGRKSDHATIAKTLERMSAQGPPELAPSAVVYTLESIDATSAMQVLRLAVPKAQVSPGPGANQFVAWARPKDHEVIQTTLENIDVETADAENARVAVYSLEGMSPTAAAYALSFLAGAIPDARFTHGAQANQLVAWATPKVQEEIADLIDQLTREPPPEKAAKVVVYSLKSISAASAVPILQTAVPGATLTPDTANPQKLTAWARPSDQEMIAGILEEIDREGDQATTSKAKVYAVEGMSATTAMTILSTTVPQARITVGTDPQQLVVWARPADHEAVRQLVEEISAAAAAQEAGRTATVYTLKSLTATAAMTFLGQVTPQAQLSAGSQPDQLIAWASPKDHETIRSTLDEIDVKGTEDTQVVVYTLDNMNATGAYYVTQFLTSAVPGARFVSGTQPGQLVAWAEPEEHEEIAELIEQLTAKAPPEKAPKAVVYSLESITSTEATQVLRAAVPNATLTPDAANPQKLTVFGTPADQQTIAAILQEIDVEVPAKMASQVKVYTVEGMTASAASIILRTEVPQARVSLGSDPQQLVVFARPADHDAVRQMIDAIAAAADAETAARAAVVYTLDSLAPTAAMTFLRQVVPQAQLSAGSQPDQLIGWASPKDHETIQATLEE
ncbi:MAG: hypothetical protein HQ582_09560, partial [Planctomycetes bacterium]|nr:hypothetical protein [Planctomycetota bacterium]